MKRIFLSLLCLGLAAAAAGCSAKEEAEGSNPGIVEEVDGESTADLEAPAFSETAQALISAFEDGGYTVSDVDLEEKEVSFEAAGENGNIEVEAKYYDTAELARSGYSKNNTEINSDGYNLVTAYSADGWEISETVNNLVNYYTLSAVMDGTKATYEIDEILEGDLENVLKVLESLGFTPLS